MQTNNRFRAGRSARKVNGIVFGWHLLRSTADILLPGQSTARVTKQSMLPGPRRSARLQKKAALTLSILGFEIADQKQLLPSIYYPHSTNNLASAVCRMVKDLQTSMTDLSRAEKNWQQSHFRKRLVIQRGSLANDRANRLATGTERSVDNIPTKLQGRSLAGSRISHHHRKNSTT